MYYSLKNYPIEKISAEVDQMQESVWDQIESLKGKIGPPLEYNITSFITPFRHLQLDPDYEFFCYIDYEYHGSFGYTAAIKRGEPHQAGYKERIIFPEIILPEKAVDPMEVVYCDGSPEGFLEAVLLKKMLNGLPRKRNIYSDGTSVLFTKPESLNEDWDILIPVTEWYPKFKDSILYFYMYKYENGMESSDGRDRISLQSCFFSDHLDMSRYFGLKSKYPHQLSGRGRYHKGKHCCVFKSVSIQIAEAPEIWP